MIPSVFSSPVPIASHQVKQAQAQGQSSNQGNSSSSQSQQSSSTSSSKVVDPATQRTQTTSAQMKVPVDAETGPIPHSGGYGPMTGEGSFMGVSSGSSGGQYGSRVGAVDHSNPVFHTLQQQQPQSFSSGSQQQQQRMTRDQQQMYLNTPEMQQGRYSQPPPTSSPYTEPQPHNELQRSNSH